MDIKFISWLSLREKSVTTWRGVEVLPLWQHLLLWFSETKCFSFREMDESGRIFECDVFYKTMWGNAYVLAEKRKLVRKI